MPENQVAATYSNQQLPPIQPLPMTNILDDICEPGPLLTPEVAKAPRITKATIQRCISKLSPHWDDEQLEAVVSMFKAHGLL